MTQNTVLPALVALLDSEIHRDAFLLELREATDEAAWEKLKGWRALIIEGHTYRDEGWVLNFTPPGERDELAVPKHAVEWEIVPAGALWRIRYCYKKEQR